MSADKSVQALQRIADWNECSAEYRMDYGSNGERDYYRKLAREALAAHQAQQEPVAWRAKFKSEPWGPHCGCSKEHYESVKANPESWPGYEAEELYAAPQQAQAPIDPDGEQSRAGFRAFDDAQVAQWAAPRQVWREAVKWAAKQAQAPGWQIVPVEPTPEMLAAVVTSLDDHLLGRAAEQQYREDWAAMLAAAPQQGSKT